jgi:hypothetical protein
VLARGGVIAWRHALTTLTCTTPSAGTANVAASASHPPGTSPTHIAELPAPVAAELINVLVALALAGTATGPAP